MIRDLGPYPAMKESGVSWLGEVPPHWEVRRLKTLSHMKSGESITGLAIDEAGEYPVFGGNGIRGYTSAYTHEGEYVLIGRQGALCGNIHRAQGRFWASEHAVVASVSRGHDPTWYSHLLRTMDLNQYSMAAAQPGLAVERVLNLWAAVPPPAEQAAIVRFLEHADRRIRRYIRAKHKLIALLEEQKQAIIHRAVTRGLDPSVRLKPSGAEWLGDVPEHWGVRRNGRLFAQRNQTGFAELPILEVSLRTGVRVRDLENITRKQMMSDRDGYKRAAKGDVAYNMMRMWQGAVGVVPVDGLVSPAYVVARPLEGIDARYFSYLFRTSAYMSEVDNCSRGIVKDRNRLYWEDFKQIRSPYPPPDEQARIASAIEERTRTVNDAVGHAEREIALLREYRTRLIADVVTGKLDVRAAAASLPDEVDEVEAPEDIDGLAEAEEALESAADVEAEEAGA